MYKLNSSRPASLLGKMEIEAGIKVRKLAAVSTLTVIAILVKEGRTIVRRIQFQLQLESVDEFEADQLN
ncbi:unnamed protein product [Phytophthora lilii]|uniref:Unnamed protein product n=1 Tax=Phytophthora lilii TaxID=2077276 RepID=A0A9W6TKF7_9STRA|nr:unnamed protein product [Phytophthora lilii]